jgi:hypothetical protein
MFVNERGGVLRTIDHERGAILKELPSHPDRRHFFELRWRNHRVEIEADVREYADPVTGKFTLHWTITDISPSLDQYSREDEATVRELIVDALRVYKASYGLGKAEVVEVTLPPEQIR